MCKKEGCRSTERHVSAGPRLRFEERRVLMACPTKPQADQGQESQTVSTIGNKVQGPDHFSWDQWAKMIDYRNELSRPPKPGSCFHTQYWDQSLAPMESWTLPRLWLLGRVLVSLDRSSDYMNNLAAWWSHSVHEQALKLPILLVYVCGEPERNRIWGTQSTPNNSRLGNSSWPSTAFREANSGLKNGRACLRSQKQTSREKKINSAE